MNKREIALKLQEIKETHIALRQVEIEKKRIVDDAYAKVLGEIDNNYDGLISMVRVSRFDMIAKEVLAAWKKDNDDNDNCWKNSEG